MINADSLKDFLIKVLRAEKSSGFRLRGFLYMRKEKLNVNLLCYNENITDDEPSIFRNFKNALIRNGFLSK